MSLFIRDVGTVPSEGWRYPGIGGHVICVRNYSIFYSEIVRHFEANGQTPPSQEEVVLWACTNLRVPCYEGQAPFVNRWTQQLPSQFKSKGCCK